MLAVMTLDLLRQEQRAGEWFTSYKHSP